MTLSELATYRAKFMAARLLLANFEAEAQENIVSFRKIYPDGEANLASLKAELENMFEVLEEHENLAWANMKLKQ